MKAIGYQTLRALNDPDYLQDIELDTPTIGANDLLVEVKAISVNPVDVKVRSRALPAEGQWGVLGWDAAGIVKEAGANVAEYQPGDRVWYAGDVTRAGANSELHAVDARIAGRMPESLSFSEAAALPLTSLTAWEMLFERLQIPIELNNPDEHILIVGASGGVGSIMIQLLKAMTSIKVIASASRPETQEWVKSLGADYVVNHRNPLDEEIAALGIGEINYVVSLNQTDQHIIPISNLIAPQGRFGLIDDPENLDIALFKRKSVSIHWEFMFTKSMFGTPDIATQRDTLNRVAELIEAKKVVSTLDENFGNINATNIIKAHELLASNKAKGKIVLSGF